jgi:hypothetical protein
MPTRIYSPLEDNEVLELPEPDDTVESNCGLEEE